VDVFLQKGDVESAKMFVSEIAPDNDGLMDTIIAAEKNAVEVEALEEQKVNIRKKLMKRPVKAIRFLRPIDVLNKPFLIAIRLFFYIIRAKIKW